MISDTLRSVPIPILALPTILSRETSIISIFKSESNEKISGDKKYSSATDIPTLRMSPFEVLTENEVFIIN